MLSNVWLEDAKEVASAGGWPPCPTDNSPKTLLAWRNDSGLKAWLGYAALYAPPLGKVINSDDLDGTNALASGLMRSSTPKPVKG